MYAATRNRTAILELLLQTGADPHVKDKVRSAHLWLAVTVLV